MHSLYLKRAAKASQPELRAEEAAKAAQAADSAQAAEDFLRGLTSYERNKANNMKSQVALPSAVSSIESTNGDREETERPAEGGKEAEGEAKDQPKRKIKSAEK